MSPSASELEVPPKDPPDWRDWVNEFPSIKSIALFCFVAWILTPIAMMVAAWLIGLDYIDSPKAIDAILSMQDKWLDALNWLTTAAVFGVVGKRLSEKPEVIRAEGEVQAAVAAAKANTPPPTADTDADPTRRPK